MPKIAPELSIRAVTTIKAEGRHAVGGAPGLHLRVSAGHRGWVLRIVVGERRRDLGLGSFPTVGLAEAREKARELHKLVRQGIAPISPKRAHRNAIVARQTSERDFDWCMAEFLKSKSPEWDNPKHRRQWETSLKTHASPHIGGMPVRDIDLKHVLRCLEPIWKIKNPTASRLRGRIELVLDWATVHGHRAGDNPARWKGHLDKVLSAPIKVQKVQHRRAVAVNDISGFMTDLRKREEKAARALEFVILTAARTGEVRGAIWSEIDLKTGVWTVPAERMKARRVHRVPLVQAALQLLKRQPQGAPSALVFPGSKEDRPLSETRLRDVMHRMEVDGVPHGFRSTFRDWVGDQTDFPRDLAEMALAHVIENKTGEAYRRSDALERRREMMEAWSRLLSGSSNSFV